MNQASVLFLQKPALHSWLCSN